MTTEHTGEPGPDAELFALVAKQDEITAEQEALKAECDQKLADLPPEADWLWQPAFVPFRDAHRSMTKRLDALSKGPGCVDPERKVFDVLWAHLFTFYEAKVAETERLRNEAGVSELDRRMQDASDRYCEIASEICHMRPVTLEGAIVLLREAASTESPDGGYDDAVARQSALAALERLAGGSASWPAPLAAPCSSRRARTTPGPSCRPCRSVSSRS